MRNRLKLQWNYLKGQEAYIRAPVRTVIRLLAWRMRCLLRWPAVPILRHWNVQIFLPARWRGISKLIFAYRDYYEPELACLDLFLSPGSTFVDAGANVGIYALVASKIVGDAGRVIAVEPSLQSFPILQKNIVLNRLKNIIAFRCALTDASGQARLYHGPNPGLNSLGNDPSWKEIDSSWKEEAEEITTEPLDRVLQRASVARVDMLKIDVQGAEELVLRGAMKNLCSARPLIIFEIFPEGTAPLGLDPYGAWELLKSIGYTFFHIRRGAFLHIDEPPADGNVLAVPKEKYESALGRARLQPA